MMKEMTEGLKYLLKDQVISKIIPVALVMNVGFYAMTAILPLWTLKILHSNSKTFGMLEAAMSAGIILGGILGSVFYKKLGSLGKVLILCLGTQGTLFLLFSLSTNPWSSIFLWGLYGIPSLLAGTTLFSILQLITPMELLGRVFGGFAMIFGIAAPIGMIVGSNLVSLVDAYLIPILEGILLILGGIYLYNLEALRRIRLQEIQKRTVRKDCSFSE